MAGWDTLTVSTTFLEGVAPVDFLDADFNEHDTSRKTTAYETAAKRLVEMRLMKAIPGLISVSVGPERFMDAAVAIATAANGITNALQEVLGWAFLIHYYEQERFGSTDLYTIKMQRAEDRFDLAFLAFVEYVVKDEDFTDQLNTTADIDVSKYRSVVYAM